MLTSALVDVRLPDGDVVPISRSPLSWWSDKNASGYIHPDDIAPDLDNPRKRMNAARLAELKSSVKARGVRQPIVVVPRHLAPWVRVAPAHKNRYFVAVSGHRRRDSASEAMIGAVPIKVAVYANEKDHRMDMSLLNKGQDDLTPLEEGYEIVELRKLDWTVDELCASFGLALPQYYGRINLTKLHPDIQATLDEDLPRDKRLSVTLGGHLGGVKVPTAEALEGLFAQFKNYVKRTDIIGTLNLLEADDDDLRFGLQKLLLAVIRKRSLSSSQAIEFIRDLTLKISTSNGGGAPVRRFEPHRRRDILDTAIDGVVKSVVRDWPELEIGRIFENAAREDVETVLKRIAEAQGILTRFSETLERIKARKRPTNPEVARLMERSTAHAKA